MSLNNFCGFAFVFPRRPNKIFARRSHVRKFGECAISYKSAILYSPVPARSGSRFLDDHLLHSIVHSWNPSDAHNLWNIQYEDISQYLCRKFHMVCFSRLTSGETGSHRIDFLHRLKGDHKSYQWDKSLTWRELRFPNHVCFSVVIVLFG
jgi:hypothetical protein